MATSAVPAAIDALVVLLRTAPELAEVRIFDGPPVDDMAGPDFLAVGWQPDGEEAATVVQDFSSAGARTRDEGFNLLCWVESWTGDRAVSARRARAFELLATVEQVLRATESAPEAPTLNGTVLWSHLTNATLRQMFTQDGARVGIAFNVSCRARI